MLFKDIMGGKKTMETKKQYKKKPDLNTRAGKLFIQQQKGLTDSESARAIGVPPTSVPQIENTKTYQAITKKFAETLLDKITMGEIADAIKDNIKQDSDKGAKNNAVKIALERIEPDNTPQQAQQVNIVLK